MTQSVALKALVEPELDDRQVQRETDNLAQKMDQATNADVNLNAADGVGDIADGGGGPMGGAGSLEDRKMGGITRVALAGAVGVGLLSSISALSNQFAPKFGKTMDLVLQSLGMIGASILEPIASVLLGPAKGFFQVGKTALEDGLGAAAGEGSEMAGEAVLEAVGADEIITSTPAEQIIGSVSLLTLVGGAVGASSFLTGLIGGGSLGATSFLSALGLGGGTIAGSALIGTAVSAGTIITAVAATAIIGSVALSALIDFPETDKGVKVREEDAVGGGVFTSGTRTDVKAPMSAFSEGAREIMQEGVGAGMGGGAPSVAQQPGEPLRVSREFARATEGSGRIGQLDQTVTVTLEGGEQIEVDQSNVESKLDNIERAIKNIDSDVTVKEQDLARGVTSSEKTFIQRRDRDDN